MRPAGPGPGRWRTRRESSLLAVKSAQHLPIRGLLRRSSRMCRTLSTSPPRLDTAAAKTQGRVAGETQQRCPRSPFLPSAGQHPIVAGELGKLAQPRPGPPGQRVPREHTDQDLTGQRRDVVEPAPTRQPASRRRRSSRCRRFLSSRTVLARPAAGPSTRPTDSAPRATTAIPVEPPAPAWRRPVTSASFKPGPPRHRATDQANAPQERDREPCDHQARSAPPSNPAAFASRRAR